MTKKTIYILLSVLLIAVSCINEPVGIESADGLRHLTAAPPESASTRTSLSNLTPQWSPGDCIWISNSEKSITVTLSQEDIRPDGKFEITLTDMPGKLYMVYPAEYVKGISEGKVTISFPEQSDGSFGRANVSAVSANEGESSVIFRNICAVFKLRLDPDDAQIAEEVEILCPGVCGQYVTSADDITLLTPVPNATSDKLTVSTSGTCVCYASIPPMTMAAGSEFHIKNKQQQTLMSRKTTDDKVIARNTLMNLSFLKEYVKLIQNSLLDPIWHSGDELTLTDGTNIENIVIKSSDIARDGSVIVSTRLLVKDNTLRGVSPSSRFKGLDTDGKVLLDIPKEQDGSPDSADITYAVCDDGTLSFKTVAPVIRLNGLPGAAKSLRFEAKYISCGQKMDGTVMKSLMESGHSSLSLELNRRGSSIYHIAVSTSAADGTIRYFDQDGKDIGTSSVSFRTSPSSVWDYGPLRDMATINLGEGYSNWISYYPDDATTGDLIMPGTHDAGTYGYDGLLTGQVKCQDINFAEQLKKGVRCFDLRLSENMNIFHGSFYCNTSLNDFLDACTSFLKNHPREAIFCFAKDENCEGEATQWNLNFQNTIDSYGRSSFVIDKKLASYELGDLRGRIAIITRRGSAGSFGYLEGAPSIGWPDDTWTTCTSGGDIKVALEDNYTAEKGDPKKNKILDFLKAVRAEGGFMDRGHRTRWIITYTSGYSGYFLGIPWPEDFCDDLLATDITTTLQNDYDDITRDGIIFFHDFIEKWDSYTGHIFNNFVKKK